MKLIDKETNKLTILFFKKKRKKQTYNTFVIYPYDIFINIVIYFIINSKFIIYIINFVKEK